MPFFGDTIYFLGKLTASNRKEAAEKVREARGKVVRELGPNVTIVVVGEGDVLSQSRNLWNDQLDAATREAFERGSLEIISEASFWDRLGSEPSVSEGPLYTPSMLAELSGLSIATIRQLQRRGLIVPIRQVHRLSYFDVQNVILLKIVRTMLDGGVSLNITVDRLRRFQRRCPGGPLSVNVMGKDVVFLTELGPVDQDGQRRLPFVGELLPSSSEPEHREPLAVLDDVFEPPPFDFESLCSAAYELELSGNLATATELYRTALAAHGPHAQINFQLAELLYRLGDLSAARERYFMAVEIDDEFVEARANLGCVLAELGNDELAVAAFRGALKLHPDYAEVRFHLGLLLHRLGFPEDAREHLRLFLDLMPDSPWAEKALEKLGQ